MRSIKPSGERKIVSLEEAMRRVQGYKPAEKESLEEFDLKTRKGFRWGDKIIERLALTKDKRAHPKMTYDESLERLQKAGFERHLRPAEYFSLIMNYFNRKENGMKGILKWSAEQMLHTESCWLSMACKREGNALFLYEDPIIKFNASEGIYQLLECGDMAHFDLLGNSYHDLILPTKRLGMEITEYLFSRTNENFPKQMHEHFQAAVEFPVAALIWPLAYSMKYDEKWQLRIQSAYEARSRGITNKQNI